MMWCLVLACFSFIRYLLGQDFPNQRIGPEPTTDRFVSVMYVVFNPFVCLLAVTKHHVYVSLFQCRYGPHRRVIPGNALCASVSHSHTLPYLLLDFC